MYPYKSEPANETERAERAVFDVVSGTLVPHLEDQEASAVDARAPSRRDSSRSGEADNDPAHEVVALADRDTLTRYRSRDTHCRQYAFCHRRRRLRSSWSPWSICLRSRRLREELVNVTISTRSVAMGLRRVVPPRRHRAKRRTLRNHLQQLDSLPTKDVDTVRRWDGKTGRTDLHLAAKNKERDPDQAPRGGAESTGHHRVAQGRPGRGLRECNSTAAFTGDRTSWDLVLVVAGTTTRTSTHQGR